MKEWMEKVKNMKKDQILILLLFGVLLIVIAWPARNDSTESLSTLSGLAEELSDAEVSEATSTSAQEADTGADNQVSELEARLEGILSQVEGVGEAQVMITVKSSGKKVVEKDMEQSDSRIDQTQEGESSVSEQSSESEATIYEKDSDGNEIPFVSEEMAPEIQGVLVIAQGADSAATVTAITEAVMALFGIEAHKIKVMKME